MTIQERVFVADGRSNAALAAARSLGAKGLAVTCGESYKNNPAFFSRHVRRTVVYADPENDPEQFLSDLEAELSMGGYQTVIPSRDITAELLIRHRRQLERYVGLCMPDHEAFSIARDKGRAAETARGLGIPVPETYYPEKQSLESIAARARFPALIKSRRNSGSRGIVLVRDEDDLRREYPGVKAAHGEPIIQEYLGERSTVLCAAFLLNADSELRATFVYEVLRRYGSSTLARSVHRPDIIEYGVRFLQALDWRGIAEMDFVVDPVDQKAKLVDVNPRFWMTLEHASYSGVDFPHLLCRLVVEGDVEPVQEYALGTYYRWFLPGDLLWLLKAKKSRADMVDFFRLRRQEQCYAILSASDPLPSYGAGLQAIHFLREKSRRDYILKRGL